MWKRSYLLDCFNRRFTASAPTPLCIISLSYLHFQSKSWSNPHWNGADFCQTETLFLKHVNVCHMVLLPNMRKSTIRYFNPQTRKCWSCTLKLRLFERLSSPNKRRVKKHMKKNNNLIWKIIGKVDYFVLIFCAISLFLRGSNVEHLLW